MFSSCQKLMVGLNLCGTHCIEVPDALEGEPLPQAHPALLSQRRKPTDCSVYISEPHVQTERLQEESTRRSLCRQLAWMEPCLSATDPSEQFN